jgi:hypothetical protein
MSKFFKVLGLLFLPVAAIILLFAVLNGKSGRNGNGFYIKEFDEQNIYG